MRYIKKIGTVYETRGVQESQKYIDSTWDVYNGRHVGLIYDHSKLGALDPILVKEQGGLQTETGYCCYCMRELYLDSKGVHTKNVTLEHIIPNKVKDGHWIAHSNDYLKYSNLQPRYVSVCLGGVLPNPTKRIGGLPHPHYVSYHNLAASCDGSIIEKGCIIPSHCCNNNRGDRYVEPLFLNSNVKNLIGYERDGKLDYDPSLVNHEWYDKLRLNLDCESLASIRRLWFLITDRTNYTVKDVRDAEIDEGLRFEILDDIGDNSQSILNFQNANLWVLFAEYHWFYGYYKGNPD